MSDDWFVPPEATARVQTGTSRLHAERIARSGPGPAGTTCGDCRRLHTKEWPSWPVKRYFKCELAGNTSGPASDFRKKWPSCGQFDPVTPG